MGRILPAVWARSGWGRFGLIGLAVMLVGAILASGAVVTDTFGARDRFERLVDRVRVFIDPPPDRPTLETVVYTPLPPVAELPVASDPPMRPPSGAPSAEPTPQPPVRAPVDVNLVDDPEAVFTSQITNKDCAVAGTQMVLTVLGLGDASTEFQTEIHDRIGEWETWQDSHNGGWGPAAIGEALAAYGATDYEVRAYDSRADALRDSAIALSTTGKPVVLLPWWGAHTWVMTGYRADADPLLFRDAVVEGTYILDPWYPRVSTIWGPSDPPGTYQDAAEMERNFIGWSRPEGAYPDRDGRFVVVVPTTPRAGWQLAE
jgi:hypothetical protein